LPTSSIDTFFACTIIVAAALMATAFLTSTLQTNIESTQAVNKGSYLRAIADYIVTSPGNPISWGSTSGVPVVFGLAATPSSTPYELDVDKVSRLNDQSNYSLAYPDIENAAKLNNIALGIKISQIMDINIEQSNKNTVGDNVSFTFTVLTNVESKPRSANLHCYVIANNYQLDISNVTSEIGIGSITFEMPNASSDNALLIVFARASFDDRITSYAIYDLKNSAQESIPDNRILSLSPLNYTISYTTSSMDLTLQRGYILSWAYKQNLASMQNSVFSIPKIIDNSPFIAVICGLENGTYFQQWTVYPQIPLNAGSSFRDSAQNVFSYIVTIKGTLCRLDISLGDVESRRS
jgi:hypothetical protein